LLEYDQNIVKHTQRLNERRITRGEAPIVWKYFQYLTLLFTEIYLDRYFHDPKALLAAINAQVRVCNHGCSTLDICEVRQRLEPAESGAISILGERPGLIGLEDVEGKAAQPCENPRVAADARSILTKCDVAAVVGGCLDAPMRADCLCRSVGGD